MSDEDFEARLDGNGANTAIEYAYRDAGNYKRFERVVLEGRISAEQIAAIRASLDDGMFFIPEQVGLTPLQTGDYDAALDHVSHYFESMSYTDEAPTCSTSAAALTEAWPKDASGWDVGHYAGELAAGPKF